VALAFTNCLVSVHALYVAPSGLEATNPGNISGINDSAGSEGVARMVRCVGIVPREFSMKIVRSRFEATREALQKVGPYLLIEVILPGGSLVAAMLYLYRRRQAKP